MLLGVVGRTGAVLYVDVHDIIAGQCLDLAQSVGVHAGVVGGDGVPVPVAKGPHRVVHDGVVVVGKVLGVRVVSLEELVWSRVI